MPLYEYQCDRCDHRLEALQKMSDERLVFCPKCNEPSLRKLISAAAFHLKGTGWYETDFKNSGKKEESKPSANGSSDNTTGKSDKSGEAAGSAASGNSSAGASAGKDSASPSGSSASA